MKLIKDWAIYNKSCDVVTEKVESTNICKMLRSENLQLKFQHENSSIFAKQACHPNRYPKDLSKINKYKISILVLYKHFLWKWTNTNGKCRKYLNSYSCLHVLDHMFLTGGPWTTKWSVESVWMVREDQKCKVLIW